MVDQEPNPSGRPVGWIARFAGFGFVAGASIGTIVNDAAATHGATLWGAPIGLGLGVLAGLMLRPARKS